MMIRDKLKKGTIFAGRKVYAIDLFCGVGGLTNGLSRAGIDVRLGVDVDPACEFPYKTNNNADFLLKSIADLSITELRNAYPKKGIRLLAGCAPCQTFSTYYQKADSSDRRWHLLQRFGDIVREMTPELVTMENVPGLADYDVFYSFLKTLKSNGYQVNYGPVQCNDYGIPQSRRRLVLLASRLGPIDILSPPKKPNQATVRKAIGCLPPIGAGEVHDRDPLHRSCSLSPTNFLRIKASRPGGTWRDWDEELVADCHKKKTGKTYPGVYGRMEWDKPAPTITTQFHGFGNGRFGHPEQDRAISLREGAILQSFPRRYRFVAEGAPVEFTTLGRLIGNAVPVKLGEIIGKSILRHVETYT